MTADGVASDFIMQNARKSVIKTINEITSDGSASAEISNGRNQMKETVGTGNAVRKQIEQNSMGIDGAHSENESTNSSKDTVSQIDGQSEDTRNRMSTDTESRGTVMQLIDDEIEKMDNGRTATLLKDKKVTEDESQCSNSTPTEFVGIPMEPISSTPRSVKTDAVSMNGISEVKELIISMDSTKIERKGNEIGIQAESEEMRRGIRENGNETMSGFEPTGIAVISRTSTVYVLSLSFSLSVVK